MKNKKLAKYGLVLGAVLLIAAGCNASTSQYEAPTNQATIANENTQPSIVSRVDSNDQSSQNNIEIKDYAFSPAMITIKKGTTITWTNRDTARHNVVAQGTNSAAGPKSELLTTGASYSYTFNTAGTYDYLCEPHPYMKAKVIVTE